MTPPQIFCCGPDDGGIHDKGKGPIWVRVSRVAKEQEVISPF